MQYGESSGYLRALRGFQSQMDRSLEIKRQRVADDQVAERERQNGLRFQREQDLYGVEDQLNDQRVESGDLSIQGLRRQDQMDAALHDGALSLGLRKQVDDNLILDGAPGLRQLSKEKMEIDNESGRVGIDQQRATIARTKAGTTGQHLSNRAAKLINDQSEDNREFWLRNQRLIEGGKKAELVSSYQDHGDKNFVRSIGSLAIDPTGRTAAELLNEDPTNGVNTAHRVVVEKNAQGVEQYVAYDAEGRVVEATNPAEPGRPPVPLRVNKEQSDRLVNGDDGAEVWKKLSDNALYSESGKIKYVGRSRNGKAMVEVGLGVMSADERGTFKLGTDIIAAKYSGGYNDSLQKYMMPPENAEDFVQAMAMYERLMEQSFGSPENKATQVIMEMELARQQGDAPNAQGSAIGNFTGGFLGTSDSEARAINSVGDDLPSRDQLGTAYGVGSPSPMSNTAQRSATPNDRQTSEIGSDVLLLDGSRTSISSDIASRLQGRLSPGQTVTIKENAGVLAGRKFKLNQSGTLEEVSVSGQQ